MPKHITTFRSTLDLRVAEQEILLPKDLNQISGSKPEFITQRTVFMFDKDEVMKPGEAYGRSFADGGLMMEAPFLIPWNIYLKLKTISFMKSKNKKICILPVDVTQQDRLFIDRELLLI